MHSLEKEKNSNLTTTNDLNRLKKVDYLKVKANFYSWLSNARVFLSSKVVKSDPKQIIHSNPV